jgi:23S rRNA (guanosine2251-2'-O)-methyltransferase
VARHGRRNEQGSWSPRTDSRRPKAPRRAREGGAGEWIWGWHAVTAALENPTRGPPLRLLATADRARDLAARRASLPSPEITNAQTLAQLLPAGAAHQGLALKAAPLEPTPLSLLAMAGKGPILMLDQVTDPQNVGAIFRSAAAFGAAGVILQDRHAPMFTGALAKAAAGALDLVPHARVTNLSRALDELADLGWRAVGLASEAEAPLDQALDDRPTVLVLGSEGEGLRRLVGEHCDVLARIPMPGGFASLNVAAAAAIALYEASRRLGR